MRTILLATVALAFSEVLVGQSITADTDARPAWAVEGVPDTVWILVESAKAEPDGDRGKALLRAAEAQAREAVLAEPDDVGRRFALAVVLGSRAEREGGKTKIKAAAELHRELVAILERDPEHARAHHMLGRLHAGVRRMNPAVRWIATRLLGGAVLADASWEEAERHLAFAEQRAPEVADHHLQLANLYRDTGRPELALEEVAHVLALPATSATERAVREEALELARTLEGKLR
jgi:tetratricopeptide (TPR) repeat protein